MYRLLKYILPLLLLVPFVAFAAPYFVQQPTIIPQTDNSYDLGTTTKVWRNAYITTLCLSADCRSSWPAGGGGTGVGTVSTSTQETAGQVPYFTTTNGYPAKVGVIGTSTPTLSSNFSYTGTFGRLLGGVSGTLTIVGLTTANFSSANISQWTNNSGYLTSLAGAASSTLLANTNTFSGTDIFSNAPVFSSLTGVLKGNGSSALTVGVDGTDFTLINALTCTGNDFFSGVTAAGVFTCTTPTGGGGSGGGTWATTTSLVSGRLINYPLNNTDIVTVGGNSTSTAKFYIDPNQTGGPFFGLGTSSPFAQLSIHLGSTNTYNPMAFAIGSSTASATTTLFSVDAQGNASTTKLFGALLTSCTGTNALTWAAGLFGCAAQPQGTVTSVTATNPLFSSGGATPVISTIFGTTTTWGMGNNGVVMTGATGIPFSIATSSALALSITGNAATVTTNANLSGVVTSSGNTTSYGSQAAGVLGNSITGNTAPMATSTLYGAAQNGKVLGYSGGLLVPLATSTDSCSSGITCSYNLGTNSFSIANNGLTLAMFPTIAANTIIGNLTGGTATPTAFGTSSIFSGTTGQLPYFSAANTLTATSSIFLSTASFFGIGSTTPFSSLSLGTGAASSSITVAEYKYGFNTNVATSTTAQIDCNASTQLAWPIGASATTLTLVNLTPGKTCRVVVQNGGATAGALTWAVPSGYILKWAGGTTPTQTTTAQASDVWSFLATQGSSTIAVFGAATTGF